MFMGTIAIADLNLDSPCGVQTDVPPWNTRLIIRIVAFDIKPVLGYMTV